MNQRHITEISVSLTTIQLIQKVLRDKIENELISRDGNSRWKTRLGIIIDTFIKNIQTSPSIKLANIPLDKIYNILEPVFLDNLTPIFDDVFLIDPSQKPGWSLRQEARGQYDLDWYEEQTAAYQVLPFIKHLKCLCGELKTHHDLMNNRNRTDQTMTRDDAIKVLSYYVLTDDINTLDPTTLRAAIDCVRYNPIVLRSSLFALINCALVTLAVLEKNAMNDNLLSVLQDRSSRRLGLTINLSNAQNLTYLFYNEAQRGEQELIWNLGGQNTNWVKLPLEVQDILISYHKELNKPFIQGKELRNLTISGIKLCNVDLSNIDFNKINIKFEDCDFSGSNLANSILSGTNCQFNHANLSGTQINPQSSSLAQSQYSMFAVSSASSVEATIKRQDGSKTNKPSQ